MFSYIYVKAKIPSLQHGFTRPYSNVDFIYKENIGSKYLLKTQRLKCLPAGACSLKMAFI